MNRPEPMHQTFFTPEAKIPKYSYYICLLLASAICICVLVDLRDTPVSNQYYGETVAVPRTVYITLLSCFYAIGFLHAIAKWFYTYVPQDEYLPTPAANMNWNFTTFFSISFIVYLYVLLGALDKLFLFSEVFLTQVFSCMWLILFSMFEQYRYQKH